jgi:pyrroloquinoline quinone biosynthesis protein B
LKVRILGSAAGGGFPQWNCNCRNCDGWRQGRIKARARTQSSIAVSADNADDARWLLINTSPEILQQLREAPALQPGRTLRDTGIAAILLMDAQVDHTTGLAMLREHGRPLPVWCTAQVAEELRHSWPLFKLLDHYCGIDHHEVPLCDEGFLMPALPGLHIKACPLMSNAPPFSTRRDDPAPGDNIGVTIRNEDSGRSLFYAPGLGQWDAQVWADMRRADCVLVDGTFWTDDEMITLGLSKRRARDMGHLALQGPGGMLEWLDMLPATTRKVLIHINNTNPVLDEDSAEHAELKRRGIELAHDGMEIEL